MTSLHGGSSGIAGTTTSEPTTTQSTMATGFTLLPPPALEIHDGNEPERWKKFRLAWSSYALATELNKKSEPVEVATLLTVIGEDTKDAYSTFNWDDEVNKNKTEPVLQQFTNYCQPRKNIPFEHYCFSRWALEAGESYDWYKQHLENSAKAVSSTLSHPRGYYVTI